MNAATRIVVRLCHTRGHSPIGILNGFSGLVKDEVREMSWESVRGWQSMGGSMLGSNRSHPSTLFGVNSIEPPKGSEVEIVDLGAIAYHIQKHGIGALICIGGFEAFTSLLVLTEARKIYPAFRIPLIHLPATISNNCPATDYSIGCDTALNIIVNACDSIKLSANAARNRVFVVEVHGGNCGYLGLLGGLCVGANACYIPENPLDIERIQSDVKHLIRRFNEDKAEGLANEGRVLLRSENTKPDVYNTAVLTGILKAEGGGIFDARGAVLGHLQQGDEPSPLDRIRATRMAVKAVDFIDSLIQNKEISVAQEQNEDEHAVVIGFCGADLTPVPIFKARDQADMKKRRPKHAWWHKLTELHRILDKRDYQQ
jgi:6-phosphofructokinase 1